MVCDTNVRVEQEIILRVYLTQCLIVALGKSPVFLKLYDAALWIFATQELDGIVC